MSAVTVVSVRARVWSWRFALAAAVALVALLAVGSASPGASEKIHGAVYSWAQDRKSVV